MPFKSKAQRVWAHTPEGTKAFGGAAKVAEWDKATEAGMDRQIPASGSARRFAP